MLRSKAAGMRVLHFAFENFQDVAGMLSRAHAHFGDSGTLVTMTPSRLGFPNGVCLNYPLMNSGLVRCVRRITGKDNVNVRPDELRLRTKGDRPWDRGYYWLRDQVWSYKLRGPWLRYGLDAFDVYHFDGDVPFVHGDRMLRRLRNARIVTHFFGSELRRFGANSALRERAQLRFTSEVDHPKIDPGLIFVPIPFAAKHITPRTQENRVLRVCHSPTRRTAKGTAEIVAAVERLQRQVKFEFVLIEGVSHAECMRIKAQCDVGIDQVGNYAGTAYGRSGLEFLALGMPTITEIPDEYEALLPGHPFIKATPMTLEDTLHRVITDPDLRERKRVEGLRWVCWFNDPLRVMGIIYREYRRLGWVSDLPAGIIERLDGNPT